jgi:serine/threonine-protein kinase
MIGRTISHYKILEKLGGGGMGVVYKAEDTKLKRPVALKFLPLDLTRDDDAKERFIHEAQTASALDHPNICNIHEIDETEDGQIFICMAYYQGETLKKKVAGGHLSMDSVIDLAIQIAQGLAKAHQHGITHRDIKPANIMVTTDGVVKIVDFGLAKLTGHTKLTKTGMTIGTVAYMSPEQARGEEVDHRTDIWSFGVVLYEMLTGQLPFKGEYEQAVVYSILNEEPKPIAESRIGVPMELERIVNKVMAKSPDARYQHMDEILDDLQLLKKEIESVTSKQRLIKAKLPQSKRAYFYTGVVSFMVLLFGAGLYLWQSAEKKNDAVSFDKYRIAVLPLANISPDPQDEYFAEGMTEELISSLSKIGGLKVIARTSVMQYKDVAKGVTEIGRELKVGTVLEGSVRKVANKLRITLQLIDAQSQEHLWSQDYDREFADVFAIQSDIAQRVADVLKVQLLPETKRQIEKKPTENLEAHNLYLRGRFYWNKRTEESVRKGFEYFKQAIEQDSSYALAYAGLADSYIILAFYNATRPEEALPKAKEMTLKALEIDDKIAEVHTSFGHIKQNELDWVGAEREFITAIQLKPSYSTAYHWYANQLAYIGRIDEAITMNKRAQEFDPLSLIITTAAAWPVYGFARQYDRAINELKKALEMDPNFAVAHNRLGRIYTLIGKYGEAIAELKTAVELSGRSTYALASLAHTHAVFGNRSEAMRLLNELMSEANQKYVDPFDMATIFIGLGENDNAFKWLDKAFEERSIHLTNNLKMDPRLDSIRLDQRYTALLKKIGLGK